MILVLFWWSSQLVEVQTLITAQVLHESWHVQGIEHIGIVYVEVLPSPTKILIHVFISSSIIHLLMFSQDFSGSCLSPLFVHHERARWLTFSIFLLECIFEQNVMHKFIRTLIVELIWVLSRVFLAIWHHVCVTSEEIACLRHFINLNGILWCLIIIIVITLADLNVGLIIFLLFEVFVLIIIGLIKIITLITLLFLTVLIIHQFGLLDEFVILFHFNRFCLDSIFLIFFILIFDGMMLG